MKKIFYLFAIIASIALVGCHDDEEPIPEIPDKPDVPDVPEVDPDDGKLTLTIGVPESLTQGGSKARVNYEDAALRFAWEASDKVAVLSYNGSTYLGTQELTLKSGEGTAKGTFETTKVKDATRYAVYYKSANLTIQEDGTATVNYDGQYQEADASTDHLRKYFCLQSGDLTADSYHAGNIELKLANSIMRFQVKSMDAGIGTLQDMEWFSNYGKADARSMKLKLGKDAVQKHAFTGFLCFHPDSMQVAPGATTGLIFQGDNRYHVFAVDADGRSFAPGTCYDLIVSTEPADDVLSNWECIHQNNAIWIATADQVRPETVPEGFVLSEGLLMNKYWGLTTADGKAITALPANAFVNLPITEVVFPNTIKEIGNSAFESCTTLKEITLPASVETIGDRAFYGNQFVEMALPDSLKQIGIQAFGNSPQLRTFTGKHVADDGRCVIIDHTLVAYAPAGATTFATSPAMTKLSAQVLSGCDQLTELTIGTATTAIGDKAFEDCSKLAQVTVEAGSSLQLGTDLFGTQHELQADLLLDYTWKKSETHRPEGNQWLGYTWKSIQTNDQQTTSDIWFTTVDNARPASVPEGFVLSETLVQETYWSFTSANGEAVTDLPAQAFANLPVTSVILPSTLRTIGASAFEACTALKEITLPASVTTIGDKAFYGTKLEKVILPNSLQTVGVQAFGNNPQLRTFVGKMVREDGRCVILNGSLVAYAPAGATSYASSYRVKRIAPQVFAGCDQLTTITLSIFLDEVGDLAFDGCSKLTKVTIDAGSMKLGKDIFGTNKTLEAELMLDYLWTYSKTHRPEGNQWNGYTWKNITIINEPQPEPVQTTPENSEIWVKTLGATIATRSASGTSRSANAKPASIAGFKEAQKVRGQDFWTFKKADGSKVTEIPAELFMNHTDLIDIWLPETVVTIGARAFKGCINLLQLTIPAGAKIIGDEAFAGCAKLSEITLPGNLQQYGTGVFDGCTALQQFKGSLVAADGKLLILKGEVIDVVPSLSGSLTLPDGVTAIRANAFAGKTGLTAVVIPEGVTTIGANAFNGCTSLTQLTIDAGYTAGITHDSFLGLNYDKITLKLNPDWSAKGTDTAKPTQNSWLGFTWETIEGAGLGDGTIEDVDPVEPGI